MQCRTQTPGRFASYPQLSNWYRVLTGKEGGIMAGSRAGAGRGGIKRSWAATHEEQQPNPDPFEPPKRFRGRQPVHVHATSRLICIPKRVPAVAHPRSARADFRPPLTPEGVVPFGFCSGGFTSTSSLRSGQRGSTEVERRPLPRWLIIPSERRRVFIRAAREVPVGLLPAQAFRLRPGRHWQQLLPLVAVLRLSRFRSNLPIPTPVTIPLRTATGAGLYARVPGLSTLFFKKKFGRISPDFRPFRPMRKVHPQAISTGGKFIPVLWKSLRGRKP
jgi:hypothetical protein